MAAEKLEQLKSEKEREAQMFYEKNSIEVSESPNIDYGLSYQYFLLSEKTEIKTIKLSNSTTPMACY